MRFGIPRSPSPSPVRRSKPRQSSNPKPRRSSTFGLQSDSESSPDENNNDTDSDTESSLSSSSSDSFCYRDESEIPLPPARPRREYSSTAEQRYVEETLASIRLSIRHHDPYEEWEKQTRKDAFRTARREQRDAQSERRARHAQRLSQDIARLNEVHNAQLADVQHQLAALQMKQQSEINAMVQQWRERDRKQRERIEGTIKQEEDNLRARLEAERRAREEEERKRKEAEERRRAEEEKKHQEEEAKRKKKEADEAEARRLEDIEQKRKEQLRVDEEGRKKMGVTTAEDDWGEARRNLKTLKSGAMKTVKGTKELKSQWSAIRRQITPKIGQLTQDSESVNRIAQQITALLQPMHPLPDPIYIASLSSLSKAILLQAETEVTAEKRSAIPIALVTSHFLYALPHFPEIFFAKLVQRAGGWPIPSAVPSKDTDGTPWVNEGARTKAMGYRNTGDNGERESAGDYMMRVAGLMRVYFLVMAAPTPPDRTPPRMYQLPRFWTYFARMLGEPRLLETAVAAQVLHVALDVGGTEAVNVWGAQWVKLLELLYEGATNGIAGASGRMLGGQSPEGKAARVRVQLEIERIMQAI